MDKLAIIYDLISGLLVSIDIIAPSLGQSMGKWLIRRLPESDDAVNPLKFRTFSLNLFLTLLPLSILVSFAIAKDMGTGATFQWSMVGLFSLGVIVGVPVVSILSLVILWLRRIYNRRRQTTTFVLDTPIFSPRTSAQDATLLALIWTFSLILGTLTLLLLRFATGENVFLAAPILTFVFTVWFLSTAMLWNRSFAKYISANPEKPYYTLARIGLLIFVLSKIVYLII